MARTSVGVSFVLKNPKNETSPVKAVFCYNGVQFYYYEKKLSIPTKYWNKSQKRARNVSSYNEHAEFNTTLDNIQAAILNCYRKFKNDQLKEPSLDELRELVKIERGIHLKDRKKSLELEEYIDFFIHGHLWSLVIS